MDVVVEASGEARGGTYDETVEVRPGGCANVPVWVSREGGDAEAFGVRGDDAFGEFFEDALREEGVPSTLGVKEGETGLCVSVAEADERTMYTRRGVNDEVSFEDVAGWVPALEGAEILFVRGYALRKEPMRSVLFRLLEEVEGPEVWFNPGAPNLAALDDVTRLLPDVDLVVMNEEEERELTSVTPLEELLGAVREVVVTRGGEEATAHTRDGSVSVAPGEAEVVDVTGAGDAFAAGYAAAYMRGEPAEERLRSGHRTAAKAISRMGAI